MKQNFLPIALLLAPLAALHADDLLLLTSESAVQGASGWLPAIRACGAAA